jgi:hypothetical protein
VQGVNSRRRRLQTKTQTQLPNCTPELHVGATRWRVDVTRGREVPCGDGRRGPSAAWALPKSPGTSKQEQSDWMPNGGVDWTAKVLQVDEQMFGKGGGLTAPYAIHWYGTCITQTSCASLRKWSSMEHREHGQRNFCKCKR